MHARTQSHTRHIHACTQALAHVIRLLKNSCQADAHC